MLHVFKSSRVRNLSLLKFRYLALDYSPAYREHWRIGRRSVGSRKKYGVRIRRKTLLMSPVLYPAGGIIYDGLIGARLSVNDANLTSSRNIIEQRILFSLELR